MSPTCPFNRHPRFMAKPAPSPRRTRLWVRMFILLTVLAGLGWGGTVVWKRVSPGLFGNKREEKIPTARVKPASISEEIVPVGRLRAVFSTELRPEISGRIMKIACVDGKGVKRDDE